MHSTYTVIMMFLDSPAILPSHSKAEARNSELGETVGLTTARCVPDNLQHEPLPWATHPEIINQDISRIEIVLLNCKILNVRSFT